MARGLRKSLSLQLKDLQFYTVKNYLRRLLNPIQPTNTDAFNVLSHIEIVLDQDESTPTLNNTGMNEEFGDSEEDEFDETNDETNCLLARRTGLKNGSGSWTNEKQPLLKFAFVKPTKLSRLMDKDLEFEFPTQ